MRTTDRELLTVRECAALFVKKLLRLQDLILVFWTVCLGLGLFSGAVAPDKFATLKELYVVVFGFWTGGGLAKKAIEGKFSNGDGRG